MYIQMGYKNIVFCPTKCPTFNHISFLHNVFCPTKRPSKCPSNTQKAVFLTVQTGRKPAITKKVVQIRLKY